MSKFFLLISVFFAKLSKRFIRPGQCMWVQITFQSEPNKVLTYKGMWRDKRLEQGLNGTRRPIVRQ